MLSTAYMVNVAHRKGQLESQLTTKKVYEKEFDEVGSIINKYANNNLKVGQIVKGENKNYIDINGNIAVIPVGFKIVPEYTDIAKGLVIEDENKNQYVWIPVGNVNKSSTETIEIKLDRYIFDENSISTPQGKKVIENYYQEELSNNLNGFITSAKINGGYYIGRYEASYASGSTVEDYKLQSQVSTAAANTMSYNKGTLWNNITQRDAAKVCKNMYLDKAKHGVESDLMNSYAWDTAIEYIQKMENVNYARVNANGNENNKLSNTGETGDVRCNIYDMATNVAEWTTEMTNDRSNPCTGRGGHRFYINSYTSNRFKYSTTHSSFGIGFRPILYVKS